jgi:hypothetical protein
MQSDLWTYRDDVSNLDIVGFGVEATDGGIGKVDEATYETGSGRIVVDTGPWIFGRKSVLPAGVIDRIDRGDEKIFVSLTKDEIKNAPEFDEDMGFSEDYRASLGEYYSQPLGAGRSPRDSI